MSMYRLVGFVLMILWGGGLQAGVPQIGCEHGICLRFPGLTQTTFKEPTEGLGGPYGFDHGCDAVSGPCLCSNYQGSDLDSCYPGHEGTDFMLLDGFRAMRQDVPVVAAANGEIYAVEDGNYDKCRLSILDLLFSDNHDGNYCGFEYNPETGEIEPRDLDNNYVIIRHFNGAYYVYTRYLHIKQGSVPQWIKDQVSSGNYPQVLCGETIAFVGSAGQSLAPHVHFDVRTHGLIDTEGLYYLEGERPPRLDPYCGPFVEAAESRKSMWAQPRLIEDETGGVHEMLPGSQCQDPYNPLEFPNVPGFCFEDSRL